MKKLIFILPILFLFACKEYRLKNNDWYLMQEIIIDSKTHIKSYSRDTIALHIKFNNDNTCVFTENGWKENTFKWEFVNSKWYSFTDGEIYFYYGDSILKFHSDVSISDLKLYKNDTNIMKTLVFISDSSKIITRDIADYVNEIDSKFKGFTY